MRAFAWDLADEGAVEVIDRLRDVGVDGLSLALAYHGGRFYTPHNPRHLVMHAPDGVLYFQPLTTCYESIRPLVHPQYGSGAFVARVAEMLREVEMSFTAWVVLFNNQTLSRAYPEATCMNVAGDRIEGALCPSNPTVRTYALALIEDLAHRVGVDAIEMEDFAFPAQEDYLGASWRGVPMGPGLAYLMSLCFCPHCRRRAEEANIEVEDLAYHVERTIRSSLAGDLSDRRIVEQTADPYSSLARFASMRAEAVGSLLDELKDAAEGSGTVLQAILQMEPDEAWRRGVRLNAIRQREMNVTIRAQATPSATHAHLERYLDLLHMSDDVVADISLASSEPAWEFNPRETIATCEQTGITRFVFSNYGLAPLDQLDSVIAHPAKR